MKISFNEASTEFIEANININNHSLGALINTEKEIEVNKLIITHVDGMNNSVRIQRHNLKVHFVINDQKYFTPMSYQEFINDFLSYSMEFEFIEKKFNNLYTENLKIGTIYTYNNSNYLLYIGKYTFYNTNSIDEFYGSYQEVLTTKDMFIPLGSDLSVLDLYSTDDFVALESYYNKLFKNSYSNPRKFMDIFLTDYTNEIHLLQETNKHLNLKSHINVVNLFSTLLNMLYEKNIKYLLVDSYFNYYREFFRNNKIKDMNTIFYSATLNKFTNLLNIKQTFKNKNFYSFYQKLNNYRLIEFYYNLGIILGNVTKDELPKTKEEFLKAKDKYTKEYFTTKIKNSFESELNSYLIKFKKNNNLYSKLKNDYELLTH